MVTEVKKFLSDDGKEFDSFKDAQEYEIHRNAEAINNFNKYRHTWKCSQLLEKHSLTECAIWEVRGEDPNCDMGGSHVEPHIGTVEGRLEDAIKWGVSQPGFWQWGGGGSFKKIEIKVLKL